jgi:PTH1 family peptidyl-tRNA hydrolase
LLLDHLARRWRLGSFGRGDRARVIEATSQGRPLVLLKPQTYMNRSGAALAPYLDAKFDPSRDLLVLVDEVALPTGTFRLRGAGTAGGHNGLKSVEGALRRQDYARLRIGVGPKPLGADLSEFVLSPLPADERKLIDDLLDPMGDAVECWLTEGIEIAMTKFNRS